MPTGHTDHGAHDAAFVIVLNAPAAHVAQARSFVASPAAKTYWPAVHSLVGAHGVVGSPSSSHVAPPHGARAPSPPAQYSPAAHGSHVVAIDADPGVTTTVPAAHGTSAPHTPWLAVAVYVPSGHASHARSLLGVPTALTRDPAVQSVHDVQSDAFASALYEEGGQTSQARSSVVVPVRDTR